MLRIGDPVLLGGATSTCTKPAEMQNGTQIHALRPSQRRPLSKSLFLLLKGSSGAASAGSGRVGLLQGLLRPGFVHARFTGLLRMSPTMIVMPLARHGLSRRSLLDAAPKERLTCLKHLCQSSDVVHRLTSATKMPRCLRAARCKPRTLDAVISKLPHVRKPRQSRITRVSWSGSWSFCLSRSQFCVRSKSNPGL